MKFIFLFLLGPMSVLTLCIGQTNFLEIKGKIHDQHPVIARGDTVSELGNNIMIVYQDKRNTYWFGSWETGLYALGPGSKNFIHYTTKDGLPHNRINEIKEDHFGNVYFNTSGGVSKYDGKSFTTLPVSRSYD